MLNTSFPLFRWLLLAPIFLFAFGLPSQNNKCIDLKEALAQNLIEVEIKSTGQFNAGALKLDIKNLTNRALSLKSKGGTLYDPADPEEQTLLQFEDQIISLSGREKQSIILDAYCTESSDRSSMEGNEFELSKDRHEPFATLVKHTRGKDYKHDILQAAVWTLSDRHSLSNIDYQTEDDRELRKFLAELSGQIDSWYRSPQHMEIDEFGNINMETVSITGELKFTSEKNAVIHDEIHDSEGKVMMKSDKSFSIRGGNVSYEFRVRVKGWERGQYFVKVVDSDSNELLSYEFSV